jgi:hypothetical protein
MNSSNTAKTGLGMTLRVMAGDKLNIFGHSYYTQSNTGGNTVNANIPVLDLINGLLQAVRQQVRLRQQMLTVVRAQILMGSYSSPTETIPLQRQGQRRLSIISYSMISLSL